MAVRTVPLTERFSAEAFSGVSAVEAAGRRSPLTQASTVSRDAPPLNRWPSSQLASEAEDRRFAALEPMPLLPEVQKGTTVLPLKS